MAAAIRGVLLKTIRGGLPRLEAMRKTAILGVQHLSIHEAPGPQAWTPKASSR